MESHCCTINYNWLEEVILGREENWTPLFGPLKIYRQDKKKVGRSDIKIENSTHKR